MSLSLSKRLNAASSIILPYFSVGISAGFPSPADDHIERMLDLNEHLIKHPSSTFFARAVGDSMIGVGIYNDDLLIIDRSLAVKDKSIVVAVLNSEFTVKRICKQANKLYLLPENDQYPPIEVKPGVDFEVWGVVTHVIHSLNK